MESRGSVITLGRSRALPLALAVLGVMGGQVLGQNLITNPGFETAQGTTFSSSYTLGTGAINGGQYRIATSAAAKNIFNTANGDNNTIAPHGGNSFLAVASTTGTGNTVAWQQTIQGLGVLPAGTTFTFTFWAAAGDANTAGAATRPSFRVDFAGNASGTVQVSATPSSVGSTLPTAANTGWTQFTALYTMGAGNTSLTLSLVNTTAANNTSDFVLDDLALVPEPSTYAAGVFVIGGGVVVWRRGRRRANS